MKLTAEHLAILANAALEYRRDRVSELTESEFRDLYYAEEAARRILESLNIEVETAA